MVGSERGHSAEISMNGTSSNVDVTLWHTGRDVPWSAGGKHLLLLPADGKVHAETKDDPEVRTLARLKLWRLEPKSLLCHRLPV